MHALKSKIKKATATRKGKIIALSLLFFLLAGIAGGIIYWKAYRKQIIRNKLEDAVYDKTEGLYSLRYDKLSLDEVAGNLTVTNITLAYDSNKYASRLSKEDAPAILLAIQVPFISVSGVKTPRALLDKEIVGKKILIRDPVIQIVYTNAGKDSMRNIPTVDVYRQILGDLNMIKVDSLIITGAQISTSNLKTGEKNIKLENTSIRLLDVAVDSEAASDTTRLLFAKQLFLTSEKISWPSKNKLYDYSADSVSLTSASGSAYVKKFLINPTLNENAFVKSLPTQDDRFDFAINDIGIHDLDMHALFNERIVADSIHIRSASFKIYRDLSIPRDKKNRVGSYPHQALEEIPVPIRVKKIVLSNAFVEYKEKNPRTNQAGKVQFFNTYATLTNVTNDKNSIQENNIMTAAITTRFLNKTKLSVIWQFHLMHPKGRFDVKGSLGSMQFADANPLTRPMGPAKLEEGRLKDLQFNFEADDYRMHGTVKMLYEDLKVSVLEKDEETRKLDKKTVASFAANIMIKNSNPQNKKEDPKVITVQMERDTNRSIFYLVWKSLFKGIKETVGIKK